MHTGQPVPTRERGNETRRPDPKTCGLDVLDLNNVDLYYVPIAWYLMLSMK